MMNIKLVVYEDRYHEDLKRLSYEWLIKYELLEPEDEKILNNPKEVVLDNGGSIIFAKSKDEVVGTASIIKIDKVTFELAKLAVAEKYRGLKIGKLLIERCLADAKQRGAEKIILYSNHKLTSALELYKKLDFIEVPHVNNKYMESDIKMELQLK